MVKKHMNPWMSIWVEPRATIRSIITTNPRYGFVLLSAAYGFPVALNFAQNLGLAASIPLWAIIIGALVLCTFLGMIGISVSAWLLKVAGRWIGGKGTFQTVRAAVAWSSVPSFVSSLMWLVLIAIFGSQVFSPQFPETNFFGYQAGVVFLVFLVQTVVSIWGFIILLKALGEVQGFSAWKALWNVVIPFAIIVGIIWLAAWLIGGINHTVV